MQLLHAAFAGEEYKLILQEVSSASYDSYTFVFIYEFTIYNCGYLTQQFPGKIFGLCICIMRKNFQEQLFSFLLFCYYGFY